jgi:hypothetical protein
MNNLEDLALECKQYKELIPRLYDDLAAVKKAHKEAVEFNYDLAEENTTIHTKVLAMQEEFALCEPFLRENETPAMCIARNRTDVDIALGLYADEIKRHESMQERIAEQSRLITSQGVQLIENLERISALDKVNEHLERQLQLAHDLIKMSDSRIAALEADNTKLKLDIQSMVEKAFREHKPAYEEQQQRIMALTDDVVRLSTDNTKLKAVAEACVAEFNRDIHTTIDEGVFEALRAAGFLGDQI